MSTQRYYYRPPTKLRKVMFYRCLSFCPGGGYLRFNVLGEGGFPGPMSVGRSGYPRYHVQGSLLLLLMVSRGGQTGPPYPLLLLASGGHHWKPVQTCSLEDLPLTGTDTLWQPPKHVQLASGQYASYWNAFLFID